MFWPLFSRRSGGSQSGGGAKGGGEGRHAGHAYASRDCIDIERADDQDSGRGYAHGSMTERPSRRTGSSTSLSHLLALTGDLEGMGTEEAALECGEARPQGYKQPQPPMHQPRHLAAPHGLVGAAAAGTAAAARPSLPQQGPEQAPGAEGAAALRKAVVPPGPPPIHMAAPKPPPPQQRLHQLQHQQHVAHGAATPGGASPAPPFQRPAQSPMCSPAPQYSPAPWLPAAQGATGLNIGAGGVGDACLVVYRTKQQTADKAGKQQQQLMVPQPQQQQPPPQQIQQPQQQQQQQRQPQPPQQPAGTGAAGAGVWARPWQQQVRRQALPHLQQPQPPAPPPQQQPQLQQRPAMASPPAATGQSGDMVYNFGPNGDSVAVALGDATAQLSPRAAINAHAPHPAGRASALARPGQDVLAAALPSPPLPAAVERVQPGSALVADALCDALLGLPYNQQAHVVGGKEEAPCPLRPCPPSSIASGLRVESFTHGTGGRLFRPGVGIGMGTMREARYEDLRFIQEIGRGGFGKVYYGHWQGAPVAIKVAMPFTGKAERQLQEFQREVTNMASLPPHPNVLKLLGACMDPQHLALVTEFCSRGSLYHLIHSPAGASLPRRQLLAIWLGVARGMQHLHACRVLHRDLKSANLLIDDMGGIKICDFGLSRLCSSSHAVQPAMTGGLGTYQWMAPEVLTSQRYSERADVYSFGMVMWESLARRVPFDGMTAMQAGLSVATQGLRPGMPPGTDPAHAWLITECWAPVADQRPTFADIVGRLEGMLASGVAEGLPPLAPHSGSSQGREEAGAYGASGLQESGRTGTTAGSSGSAGGQPLPPPQQPRQELATRHGVPRPVPCAARALGGGGGGRGAPGDPGVVPRALVAWGAGKGAQQPPAHGRVQRMVGPPPMLHRRITHTGV